MQQYILMLFCLPLIVSADSNRLTLSLSRDKIPVSGFLVQNDDSQQKQGETLKIEVVEMKKMIKVNEERLSRIEVMLKNMQGNDDEGYIGCYQDDGSRLLDKFFAMNNEASLTKCKSHCKGYKYLGLQAGHQCFCGNNMDKKYPKVSGKDCNINCLGEPKRMCGGHWRNSIYKV